MVLQRILIAIATGVLSEKRNQTKRKKVKRKSV